MGTKKTTTQTNQYDPSSMAFFQSLQPTLQKNFAADLQLDPTQSPVFNMALNYAMKNAHSVAGRNFSNMATNFLQGGGGANLNAFNLSQLNNANRFASKLQSDAYTTNYINFDTMRRQMQMQATGIRPLQTGSTQVQQTSGLGTWLPQVAGMAVGAALTPFTGGTSLLGSLAAKGGGLAGNSILSRNNDYGGGYNPWTGGYGGGGGGGYNGGYGGF